MALSVNTLSIYSTARFYYVPLLRFHVHIRFGRYRCTVTVFCVTCILYVRVNLSRTAVSVLSKFENPYIISLTLPLQFTLAFLMSVFAYTSVFVATIVHFSPRFDLFCGPFLVGFPP